MKNPSLPFFLFVLALFLGFVSQGLLADGMFMDGLIYATISRNLAQGLGSFWDLHFTNTLFPHFHEHPPLAFGLQALFFRLFGDHILVERLYSIGTYFITAFLVLCIWQRITKLAYTSVAWLPLFFWICMPLVSRSARNNLLENTLAIFVTSSVLFILKSLESHRFGYLTLSGILLFLGLLTKGFVALFPWSLLLWIWLVSKRIGFNRLIMDTTFLILATVTPFVLIYLLDPAGIESLKAYVTTQVARSLLQVQTVDTRLHILYRLVQELLPPSLLVAGSWVAFKRMHGRAERPKEVRDWTLIFLALAISGVIPVIVSLKQTGFYILASFPFFGVALALLVAPQTSRWIDRLDTGSKGFAAFRWAAYALVAISLVATLSQIGKVGRDHAKVRDVHAIIGMVPRDSTISVGPELSTDWALHGYFGRYANVSLDADSANTHEYLLRKAGTDPPSEGGYRRIDLGLSLFDLYDRGHTSP